MPGRALRRWRGAKMQLELTASAEADYFSIIEYSFAEFGEETAVEYANALDEAFTRLIDFPQSGISESRLRGRVRSLACRKHRVFYTLEENGIVVRRILYKSMDAEYWLV